MLPKMLYAGTAHGGVWQNDFTADPCGGDFDQDGDVDGVDLSSFISDPTGYTLAGFAAEFARVDCPL